MQHDETAALYKKLIDSNLIDPNWASVNEIEPNEFALTIKSCYSITSVENFLKEHGLLLKEEKEKKQYVIYKQQEVEQCLI
jgi:gentisate 1,2-dioxygenase